MWPSIADNFILTISEKPRDIQEMMIRDAMPIVKPIMLKIVENDIKPKLCRDPKCRIAMRDVRFTNLPAARMERE